MDGELALGKNVEWHSFGLGDYLELIQTITKLESLVTKQRSEIDTLRENLDQTLIECDGYITSRALYQVLSNRCKRLLERLREWDVMDTGDGEYWRYAIDEALSLFPST